MTELRVIIQFSDGVKYMGLKNKKISEFLDEIKRREIALPEMQREYVWNERQVRDLIDSIYRGYPAGLILLWKKPYGEDIPETFISDKKAFTGSNRSYRDLVVDGQQRLTSLLLVENGDVKLYFNPLKEEFQLESQRVKYDPLWFNVTDVVSKYLYEVVEPRIEKLKQMGMDEQEINEKIRKPLEKLREQFRTYEFPVYEIPSDIGYGDVADIFTRINLKGTRIRTTDLLIAMFSVRAPATFRPELRKLSEELSDENWDLDASVLVRCIVGMAKGEGNLTNFRRSGMKITKEELREGFECTREYLWQLVHILKDIGVDSSAIMPSGNVLPPLAVYLKYKRGRISEEERKQMILWFLLASFWGRYAGATDTRLGEDIKEILNGNFAGLFKNLKQQVGRLLIDKDAFVGRSYGNRFLLYMLCFHRCALDWFKGHRIKSNFEVHHIFPKTLLENQGYPPILINHIGNLAFLSEKANRSIRKSEPIKYLPSIPQERLTQQLVPIEHELWEIENYENFLVKRTDLIVNTINGWFIELGLGESKD